MPPKPKFTKENIAVAALDIVKEEGVEALTARSLGNRLGSSARPIFTVFKNMQEVKWAARKIALKEFEQYVSDFREYTPAFKRIGMLIVYYGMNEPELFKLLFMQEHTEKRSFENTIQDLGDTARVCIELIERDYSLTAKDARLLFEQMWVHAFAMGALCAMKVCDFSESEISEKLGQVFAGMIMVIKSGKSDNCAVQPEKDTEGKANGQQVGDLPYLQN